MDQRKINLYPQGNSSNGYRGLKYIWERHWSTEKATYQRSRNIRSA